MIAPGVSSVYDQYRRLKAIANDPNQSAEMRFRANSLISSFAATHPQWIDEFETNTSSAKLNSSAKQANLKIYLALGFLLALFLFLMVWKIILKK